MRTENRKVESDREHLKFFSNLQHTKSNARRRGFFPSNLMPKKAEWNEDLMSSRRRRESKSIGVLSVLLYCTDGGCEDESSKNGSMW